MYNFEISAFIALVGNLVVSCEVKFDGNCHSCELQGCIIAYQYRLYDFQSPWQSVPFQLRVKVENIGFQIILLASYFIIITSLKNRF